jgi:hypothetical protein
VAKEQPPSVSEISAKIENEGLGWEAAETPLTSLPVSEQVKYLGLIITEAEFEEMATTLEKQAAEEIRAFESEGPLAVPAAWDWRNVGGKNYVTPVKNQGSCASGICFATSSVIESSMRVKAQDPEMEVDRSVAFMLFCGGGDCSNGLGGMTSGLEFAKNTGVPDEACFPYQPQNMSCSDCCEDWESRLVKILSFTSHSSMQARKSAIATNGPVLGVMRGYSDFMAYNSGVYWKASGSSQWGGYIPLCLVGYNDDQQCWIAKLSWGTAFGESGFCRIGYGQADLAIDSSLPFYSVDPDVAPRRGCATAEHTLFEKRFEGSTVFWAYVGGAWRHKIVSDGDLAGIAQELSAATPATVCWDGNQITLIRTIDTL